MIFSSVDSRTRGHGRDESAHVYTFEKRREPSTHISNLMKVFVSDVQLIMDLIQKIYLHVLTVCVPI